MGYIKEEEINEIRQRADIVDIISSYLNVSQKGKNYVVVCPFHDDHSPSMVISKERQIFNCFTCRTGGNVFSFIMKYENVNFVEAINIVAQKIGYELKSSNILTNNASSKFAKEYDMMNFAQKFYINNMNTELGIEAKNYLQKRGITSEIIKEFNIGLALNEKDTLYKLLLAKKNSLESIEELGLVNKYNLEVYDTYTNRIMIPICDLKGQVVGFTGRIFHNEDTAKYINTKETKIFKKSNILFNYHNARQSIREQKKVIVVEGNMDAIKVSASGIKNVIALMGVALSNTQIDTLKKLRVPVILILDNDDAGLNATVKLGELLLENNVEVEVVRLNGAKDPDEYIEKYGISAFKDNVNHAIKYIDFKLDYLKANKNLNNIEDLIAYVKEVLNSLKNTDDLTKEVIISKISKDYAIDPNILKKELKIEKEQVKKSKDDQIIRKTKSRYAQASSKVLFAMMDNPRFITIYKNKLGFFKEKFERIIATEIVYYNNENNGIKIADFTSFIMMNEEIYPYVLEIINENAELEVDEDQFNKYIDIILKEYQKDEIKKLKEQIKIEMDINKKVELLEKLTKIKKGSVENEGN